MGCAILIPVLARPQLVSGLLENIASATPSDHHVLFLTDQHDDDERDAIAEAGGKELVCGGNYAAKINRGIAATGDKLVFLGADDLRFHPGWLEAAIRKLKPGIGVVGTNDLGNPRVMRGDLATHSLVTRAYAERGAIDGGGLLHEGYAHNWVDEELIATARKRNAFAFARMAHVEHLHPHWGKATSDATYTKGQATFADDHRLFRSRKRLWAT